MQKSKIAQQVIVKSTELLTTLLTARGVPDSHGMGHCTKVLEHMYKTLEGSTLPEEKQLSMKLGALLHDADDRKYFEKDSKNAENIINESLMEVDQEKVLDDHQKI